MKTSRVGDLCVATVVLGAIWWGGGTEPDAQVLVLAAMSAVLVAFPANAWPQRSFYWIALAWLGVSALAYLPARMAAIPAWRDRLVQAGIDLPVSITPQPYVTTHALIWLLAGLAWAGWLTARRGGESDGRRLMRLVALGIVLIAAVALGAWKLRYHVPGWLSERGFGPFPNRNHTGTMLGIGGVLAFGCAADALRRRRLAALAWSVGGTLVFVALIVNYSRGGLLVFAGGIAVWGAIGAWQRRSWAVLTLVVAVLLFAASAVLLMGGATAERFSGGLNSQVSFRGLIWRDALHMIGVNPWTGIGLGNFRAVFPFFREASAIQQAVWHPESDWLWLAAESSWLSVALALALFIWFVRAAFPFARGSHRAVRGAALGAAIAAGLHALVDVPMHRPAVALLVIVVLAIARKGDLELAPAPAAKWFWRTVGVAMLAMAAWWWHGQEDDLARAETFAATGQFDRAVASTAHAIERAPLNWEAYYTRAAIALRGGRILSAIGDFRRANLLEPNHASVPFEEGKLWLPVVPRLAAQAWAEALSRVGAPGDLDLFRSMLRASPDDAAFREMLLGLAKGRPNLQVEWFCSVPIREAEPYLDEITPVARESDPALEARFHERAATLRQRP